MLKERDIKLISALRRNSRCHITELKNETGVPTTTIFGNLKRYGPFIIKNTTLFHFDRLGYPIKVMFVLKADNNSEEIINRLSSNRSVNNIYRGAGNCTLIVEGIFRDLMDLHEFTEELDSFRLRRKKEHRVIEAIAEEKFFTQGSFPKGALEG